MIILILIPIYFVIRLNLMGIIVGSFFVWLILILNGMVLNYLDPHREGGINDGLSLIFGGIEGLLYCGAIYLVRLMIITFRKNH
jgi:uncharacterized membrane protein SpoIIM required for sporulation